MRNWAHSGSAVAVLGSSRAMFLNEIGRAFPCLFLYSTHHKFALFVSYVGSFYRRACISRMKNERGLWLCWMWMGRKAVINVKNTTHDIVLRHAGYYNVFLCHRCVNTGLVSL